MNWKTAIPLVLISLLCAPYAARAASASALAPGLYEYTMKMSMSGMAMPTQTSQRCLTAKDVEGNKAFEMPSGDCQIRDMVNSGAQFSYKMSCTKPQKMDASVKGTMTTTSLSMEMTMAMAEAPGPMTQSITAKRLGDCKS